MQELHKAPTDFTLGLGQGLGEEFDYNESSLTFSSLTEGRGYLFAKAAGTWVF